MKNPAPIQKMPVEATDVDQPFETEPQAVPHDACQDLQEDLQQDTSQNIAQDKDTQSPPKRGRPAGSKDKQPRRRPVRAVSPVRPVTRRSAPLRQTKRVQIKSASEASSSDVEVETPRTARHRQYIEHRQHKQDMHRANVNRYAALFDRMLA